MGGVHARACWFVGALRSVASGGAFTAHGVCPDPVCDSGQFSVDGPSTAEAAKPSAATRDGAGGHRARLRAHWHRHLQYSPYS